MYVDILFCGDDDAFNNSFIRSGGVGDNGKRLNVKSYVEKMVTFHDSGISVRDVRCEGIDKRRVRR